MKKLIYVALILVLSSRSSFAQDPYELPIGCKLTTVRETQADYLELMQSLASVREFQAKDKAAIARDQITKGVYG